MLQSCVHLLPCPFKCKGYASHQHMYLQACIQDFHHDMQVIEMHLHGEEHERPVAFDLQQRVYVHTDPCNLVPYYPDEIASR